MKYVNVIINSAYTAPYISLIERNFKSEDHLFFVIRGWSESKVKIPVQNNVIPINNISNLLNGFRLIYSLNRCRKIVLHGLFSPFLLLILVLQPWLLKKSNWVIWGGDLYQYNAPKDTLYKKFEEFLRRIVLKNIAEITTVIKGDYNLAKKWYNVKGRLRYAMYSVPLNTNAIDKIIKSNVKPSENPGSVSILIGNSADPGNNHFEIIEILKKFKNEEILIYSLLNYGDSDYADKVIEYGKKEFGEKFIGIVDYMQYDDFILFMNNIEIIVFNHKRQQALGNLFLAYYLKKKVFINTESTLYEFFRDDLGLTIRSTLQIPELNFQQFVSTTDDEVKNNRLKVTNVLEEDYIVNQWRLLFDKE